MARPLKPLVKSGGYYPSRRWTPLVYPGGYTTANGGGQPEPEAVLKTVTGSLIHITDALALPAEALSVNVEPIQDLHGYDSPWPAGGGVNLLPFEDILTEGWTNTLNGITATYSKGVMRITGTSTASGWTNIVNFQDAWANSPLSFGTGSYNMTDHLTIVANIDGVGFRNKATTFTAEESVVVQGFYIAVSAVATVDWTIPMMFVKGTARPTSYAPYSNICPISGRTSATIYRSGADTSDPTTYTIQFGDTVYGGTLDVTQGKMVVDRAYKLLNDAYKWGTVTGTVQYRYNEEISRKLYDNSYTGLTCTIAPTISDANYTARWQGATVYYFGIADKATTPVTSLDAIKAMATAGQIAICYAIEPVEITLTPTQIKMLLGENNLWSDAGDSTLTYYAEGEASTSEALGILLGNRYYNNHEADEPTDREALDILLGNTR